MAAQPPFHPPGQQDPPVDQTSSGSPPSASPHEFVSPNASDQARLFIAKGRTIMYDPAMKPAVRAAITGAKDLASGIAMYVTQLVAKLEDKMGQLSEEDFLTVVSHLCGSMVDLAKSLGDPDAQDSSAAVKACVQKVMEIHAQGQNQNAQPPDPNADPSQAPPMSQFGGAPQGPPQMQGPPQ